jgi:hypothetical protein
LCNLSKSNKKLLHQTISIQDTIANPTNTTPMSNKKFLNHQKSPNPLSIKDWETKAQRRNEAKNSGECAKTA